MVTREGATLALINCAFAAGCAALFLYTDSVKYLADQTYLTQTIAGLGLVGVLWSLLRYRDAWRYVRLGGPYGLENVNRILSGLEFWGRLLVTLGLAGTVLGMILAMDGVTADALADPGRLGVVISTMTAGFATAFHTTIVGMAGKLWINVNARLIEVAVSKAWSS